MSPNRSIPIALLIGLAWATPLLAADAPKADLVNRQQLRVCTDPADLPFSNDKGEGFENKIANLIGEELNLPVVNTYYPKATGFIRQTLSLKKCDLVIGWGQGDEFVLNTNAIYRTTEAIIYKKGSGFDGLDTLADPRLQHKVVGVLMGSPGGTVAAHYGLMEHVHGYPMMVDRRYFNTTEQMMKDIMSGEIDVGVNGLVKSAYWAKQVSSDLVVVPMLKDAATSKDLAIKGIGKLDFRITMGVRPGDDAWKRQLNQIIAKRQGDIDKIIMDYGIPILVDDDTKYDLLTSPRPNGALVSEEKKAEGGATGPGGQAAAPSPSAAPGAQ